jgi:hypothetical protein
MLILLYAASSRSFQNKCYNTVLVSPPPKRSPFKGERRMGVFCACHYKSINKLNTYTKKASFASTVNLKVNESEVVREITLEIP